MAIVVEFFNIIVPKAVIAKKYPGSIPQYRKHGGPTFLEDEYLTRVGAMNWSDVQTIIRHLEQFGIRASDQSGKAMEIVVVDMVRGPMAPCDWIEFDNGEDGPRCWLHGTLPGDLARPHRPGNYKDTIIALTTLDGALAIVAAL